MPDACTGRGGEQLEKQLAEFITQRTVIVGMGSRQKGDDGLGPAVIEGLEGTIPLTLIDAGTSPENSTQNIVSYKPDTVLFIDAADIGKKPGEMALYRVDEIMDVGIGTHTGNVSLLEQYIHSITEAECLFLLVQPADVKYRGDLSADGEGTEELCLSPAAVEAVKHICVIIVSLFGSKRTDKV